MSNAPISTQSQLTTCEIETPLGTLFATANKQALISLSFSEQNIALSDANRLLGSQEHPVLKLLRKELAAYFSGKLKTFTTPMAFHGTAFQQSVWKSLVMIPFGETRSYAQMSKLIQKPTAFRAVANANGANRLVIIVPCHRVIYADGSLGGYSAGLARKEWLLTHEGIAF